MRVNLLTGRSIISVDDLTSEEFEGLLELALRVKRSIKAGLFSLEKEGKSVALLFQKPSTRTRLSLEVACNMLKMHPIALNWNELQLSRGEPLSDTARVFGKMVHCVAARVFSHDDLYTFRDYAKIPIINALSDKEHPLQALADFMTIKEKFGDFKKVKIAYVGDGNNVANSLILATAKVGAYISVATPLNLKPSPDIVARAKIEARKTGAKIEIDTNPQKAVESADVVYTDVWVSMGQEAEASSKIELLKGYQVNDQLFALAKPEAYFMHCLPAHRGQEVTESVIDGPRSIVFEQAENRLYTTIAVFYSVL